MLFIKKCNKGIPILLYVINIFSGYVWIVLLNDKKRISITNAF